MLSNFEIAAKEMPPNFKSLNWDAFPNGYSDLIRKEEIWPRMLRNAITIGFNDALLSHSNKRFETGNLNLWKEMKQGGFPDLIQEKIHQNLKELIIEKVKKLIFSIPFDLFASQIIIKVIKVIKSVIKL